MRIIEKRKIFYLLSLLVILPGLISLAYQGLNTGIDFKGGTMIHVQLGEEVTVAEVRDTIADTGLVIEANIQKSQSEFYIRTAELTSEQSQMVSNALAAKYEGYVFMSLDSVGATIGSEITRSAILALLVAAVLMLLYISVRFQLTFGIAAILGVLHNVLIVLGFFSIFQWEINSAFIAAILTVIGYSINDTIVVFDRVRENIRMKRREDDATMLNRSIIQVLNRSINTVLTSTLALLALYFFGGATIQLFVLAMIIGFVSGAYSSIFIASPIWYDIRKIKPIRV